MEVKLVIMERAGAMISDSDLLKSRRRRAGGLTQQGLADLAGVKLSLIADVESGRQRLSKADADKIYSAIDRFEAEVKHKNVRQIFIQARLAAGLTQEQVATEAKIDVKEYSKWEAEQTSFDGDTLERVEKAIDWLHHKQLPPGVLRALAGGHVASVARKEERKEADRAIDAIYFKSLSGDIAALERKAAKVESLQLENLELRARIAALEKKLKAKKGRN